MPQHTPAEKRKNKKAKKSNLAPPFEKKSKTANTNKAKAKKRARKSR